VSQIVNTLAQLQGLILGPNLGVDEQDPNTTAIRLIVEYLTRAAEVTNGQLGFGLPPGASETASKDNIHGAWVRGTFEATDTKLVFSHNLNLPLSDGTATSTGNIPNVRWFVTMLSHSGAGAAVGASTMNVQFEQGDTVTPNSIELRLYAEATRTIAAGANAVTADLFFIPAEQ